MQTPSKLALSFIHTKIVQYGQKRMDFRYMIYGLDKIPQDLKNYELLIEKGKIRPKNAIGVLVFRNR